MASFCEGRASAVKAMERLAATVQPEWLSPRRTAVHQLAAESSQSHDSSSADDSFASLSQPPVAPLADSDSSIGPARSGQSSGGGGSTSGLLSAVKQVKQRFLQLHLYAMEAQVLLQELRNGHLGRLPLPLPIITDSNTANASSPRLARSAAVARVVPLSSGTRVPRSLCKRRFPPASETPDSLYALSTSLTSNKPITMLQYCTVRVHHGPMGGFEA